MSQEAVGQDLLSILRMFTSPTMGPFSNTNATPPMPPDPSMAGQANEEPPPGRPGMPPGFPQPVSRRVVADAANVPAAGAQATAGTSPRGPAPATPSQAQPAPVADPEHPEWLASQPDYQAFVAQQARLRKEALEQQRMDLLVGGLGRIAGSAVGDEGMANSAVGGIDTTKLPSNALPLDKFTSFKQRADDAAALVEDNKRIDTMLQDPQMKGRISKEVLLSLRANNKAAFTDIVKDYFSAESETKVLEDGTIVSRRKNSPPGTQFTPVNTDQAKAAAVDAARRKTEQEISSSKTSEEKTRQEIEQGKIDPAFKNDESLRVIARQLQMDPNDPAVIATIRTMSATQLQDAFKTVSTAAAGRNDPRKWESTEIENAQAGRGKLNSSISQIPTFENLTKILDKGKPRMGSWSADVMNAYYRNINTVLGSPLDEKTLGAGQFQAQVANLVRNVVKDYGSNASNADRMAASQEFGADTPPEVARAQLALVLKAKIWDVQKHNADIQDRIDNTDMSSGNKSALNAQKVSMPKVDDRILTSMNIMPGEVAALKAAVGTPEEAEMREAFQERHGRMVGEWALGELKR